MHEHSSDEPRDPFRPEGARIDDDIAPHLGRLAADGRSDLVGPDDVLGLQRAAGNAGVTAMLDEERSPVHDVISSGGRPLEPDVRTDMESRLGADFGDVRVHDDAAASSSAKAVNANAYTVGSNVVFQRDTYDPSSTAGQTTLAHELTHVIQQRSGPVDGTSVPGGLRVSDPGDRFEREAVANADRVMTAHTRTGPATVPSALPRRGGGGPARWPLVQRTPGDDEWNGLVISGGPNALVDDALPVLGILQPDVNTSSRFTGVIAGNQLHAFIGTERIRVFRLDDSAAPLAPGLYVVANHHLYAVQINGSGDRARVSSAATRIEPEDGVSSTADLVVEDQRAEYIELGGGRPAAYVISGSRGGIGGDGNGDDEGEGEGTPLPQWAHDRYRFLSTRMQVEQRQVRDLAARTRGEISGEALVRIRRMAGVPDRLALWNRDDDVYVNVWTGDDRGAVRISEDESASVGWERVQSMTRALVAGVRVRASESAEQMALGVAEGENADPESVAPNTEAYPSSIRTFGPSVAIEGSGQPFVMSIDYRVEGRWGTLAAFGIRRYTWEVFRLLQRDGLLGQEARPARLRRQDSLGEDISDGLGDIGEDLGNTVDEEGHDLGGGVTVLDPGTAALALLDAGVRSVGTLVSSVVRLASRPLSEHDITFDEPGTYVVRCTSARAPLDRDDAPENPVVRAPSVAVYPIRVSTAQARARELTSATEVDSIEAQIADLRARIEAAEGDERADLERQLADLEGALGDAQDRDAQSVPAALRQQASSINDQLEALNWVERLRDEQSDSSRWSAELLLTLGHTGDATSRRKTAALLRQLHVQLVLTRSSIAVQKRQLEQAKQQTALQARAVGELSDDLSGIAYRPHASYVPDEDGRARTLTLLLSQTATSSDEHPSWLLVDLSTPGHRDRYAGHSSTAGPAGHGEAIAAAFRNFAGEIPYGRGTLGVRLTGPVRDVADPIPVSETMRAAPDTGSRWRQRLESLSEAAGLAAMVVTGPAGAAIGLAGAAAGATVATYRIIRRHEGGYLELDLATAMDVMAVVGAATAGLGTVAGSVPAGTRWVRLADHVEGSTRIFGHLQMGGQVLAIPYTLAEQLAAIDAMEGLSPGERAARRAEAFLSATRSGLDLVVSAHEAATAEPVGAGRRPKLDDVVEVTRPQDGATEEPMRPATDQIPDIPHENGASRSDTAGRPAAVDGPDGRRRPAVPDGDDGVHGNGADRVPVEDPVRTSRPRTPDGDEGIPLIEIPGGTVAQLPAAAARSRARSRDFFESFVGNDVSREHALLNNPETGEYIIVVGRETHVELGEGNRGWREVLEADSRFGGHWDYIAHSHPVDPVTRTTALRNRLPSGATGDFAVVVEQATRTGRAAKHDIRYRTEHGMETTRFGYDPTHAEPYWIEVPGAEPGLRRFATIEDYHDSFAADFGGPPSTHVPDEFPGVRRNRDDDTDPMIRLPQAPSHPEAPASPVESAARLHELYDQILVDAIEHGWNGPRAESLRAALDAAGDLTPAAINRLATRLQSFTENWFRTPARNRDHDARSGGDRTPGEAIIDINGLAVDERIRFQELLTELSTSLDGVEGGDAVASLTRQVLDSGLLVLSQSPPDRGTSAMRREFIASLDVAEPAARRLYEEAVAQRVTEYGSVEAAAEAGAGQIEQVGGRPRLWPHDGAGQAWEVHHVEELSFGGADVVGNYLPLPVEVHDLVSAFWESVRSLPSVTGALTAAQESGSQVESGDSTP